MPGTDPDYLIKLKRLGMKSHGNSICFNCGIRKATTLDHVISKTLIPEPRPNNLVTVPACEECNQSFSKDEEYLRDRLSAAVAGVDFDPPSTWDKAWRSMRRPEARGKKLGMFKDVLKFSRPFETKHGPSGMGIVMEKRRVDRVVGKMIRGFYFHHFKKPLGDVSIEIEILSNISSRGDRQALIDSIRRVYDAPTWAQNFGPDTSVVCALVDADGRVGVWAFKIMGQHIIVAVVAPHGHFDRQQSE